ncbi:HinT-interacting membrane complex protein P80 [Mesomycoplasma ovipneumoniae]|uniref:HinT-interacting membrane complex protein P80 n=1 Tax=Mesomycoplasma ovipneumoniae TaxID=29562 RepID=UPI0030808371
MKKQNIFQKIANLNSDSRKKPQEKAPAKAKKIWIPITLTAGFLTVIGLGVGIPLSYSSGGTNHLEIRDPKSNIVILKSPISDKNIKVEELLSVFKSDNSKQRDDLREAQKYLIEFLYNQEYEASKVFQAAWENTNTDKTQGNSRRFTLQSFEEIRQSQRNFLHDERSRYQTTFGFNNWETEFNKYLNSDPRFNNAVNINQAVEALSINAAQDVAFARFKLGINKNFTKSDIEDRILKDDIKDEKGQIVYKKGEKLFAGLIEIGKNGFGPNIVSPNPTSVSNDPKISAFITNSFIKEYVNPTKIINEIYFDPKAPLAGNFNFFEISQISINAKPNAKDAKSPWSVDKKTLQELLTYKVLKTSSESSLAEQVSNNLELIENFKGGNSTDPTQNNQDKILLSTLDYENNKRSAEILGQLPIASLSQTLINNEAGYIFAFLENASSSVPKQKLFSKTLMEKLKDLLFKNAPSLLVDPSELNSKSISEIRSLNQRLHSYIQGLSDNELTQAGKAFLETFGADENDYRTHLVYNLGDNLKLVLDSKGMKVLSLNKISSLEEFNKIISHQLQLSANNQVDSKQNSTINMSQLFADISNNNFIQSLLVRDANYQKQLLESKKTTVEQEKTDFLNSVLQSSENFLNFYVLSQVLNINQKLQDYISNATLNDLSADFWYNNQKERWELKADPSKELRQAIIDKLESLFRFSH